MDERKSAETPSQQTAAWHLISWKAGAHGFLWKAKEEILGIFHINTSSQVQFNIFIYKIKLVYAFGFQESAIFSPETLSPPWFIDPHGISATRNMKSRLEFKFPTPYERQMPGVCPRGCWSFDLTGTLSVIFMLGLFIMVILKKNEVGPKSWFYTLERDDNNDCSRTHPDLFTWVPLGLIIQGQVG